MFVATQVPDKLAAFYFWSFNCFLKNMQHRSTYIFDWKTILLPITFTLLMWIVFYVERRFMVDFSNLGIRPGSYSGLCGVIFSPLLHGGINHLWSNTIPVLVLGSALSFFYREQAGLVLVLGWVLSGLLTWYIGRPSYHIGASGVIYALVFFLFFKGLFTRYYRLIALSLLVAFFYGSMVWYIFPVEQGISWEGHLSGAIAGTLLAFFTKNKIPEKHVYAWQKEDYNEYDDPFMRQFDEHGNFFEIIKEEEEE